MEDFLQKLKTYLHMEEELPLDEFSNYYKDLITRLNSTFEDMDHDACIKARYICSIVQANADSRAKQSKTTAKAFKKISTKCSFWADAINFRLIKEGMSQSEIDQAIEKINEAM